ncbi:MAG: PLP-dependent transferase, partial [Gammaproteobacteria bacterium]
HGSLLAFIVKGDLNTGKKFADNLKLCLLAENLGSVETLVTHPASMTHGYLTQDERQSIGITDSLIRMSVGIEDPEDLLNDIKQSLASLHG